MNWSGLDGYHFRTGFITSTHWLTWFVGEYGLANRTRPHPELGVLSCFRVASQMFTQTSLIHVVFTTHRAGMVGRSTFGHVRTSTDIRVTWEKNTNVKIVHIFFEYFILRSFFLRHFRIFKESLALGFRNIISFIFNYYYYYVTHFVRRPATRWSDRCGGLSYVRPVTRYLGTIYDTADKT